VCIFKLLSYPVFQTYFDRFQLFSRHNGELVCIDLFEAVLIEFEEQNVDSLVSDQHGTCELLNTGTSRGETHFPTPGILKRQAENLPADLWFVITLLAVLCLSQKLRCYPLHRRNLVFCSVIFVADIDD
jgi:hypothetical protein